MPNLSDPGSLSNLVNGNFNGNPSALGSISAGDTTFVLLATILVFLMIPGLGLFYQGLARKKFAYSILMQCIISIPVTTIIWIFGGFGFIFGSNLGGGFLGDPSLGFAMNNIISNAGETFNGTFAVNIAYAPHVPFLAFWVFQLMFAIITPPLMVGAFSERMTWGKYLIFLIFWQYLVYIPVAHWIWGGGFLAQAGVVDWAGGIVIHTTAGFGALVTAYMLGKRKFKTNESKSPSNLNLVIIGGALIWFGWFGFNSGGAMGISTSSQLLGGHAVTAFLNTAIAPSFAIVTWIIAEKLYGKKISLVGIITASIAGLAAITPASGYVPIWASMIIGSIAGVVCYFAAEFIKSRKSKVDDALDVFGVHGCGGMTGAILIGALALNPNGSSTAGVNIDLIGGYQLGIQIAAVVLVALWTSFFTALIVLFVTKTPVKWGYKTYKPSFEEDIELWHEENKISQMQNWKITKLFSLDKKIIFPNNLKNNLLKNIY